ncbi:hypothetical protein CP533_1198 [Ophiocordyceps camponoti-saundersi (nom. inval.)]|nr:hypothetical protein CP533_1198 [Ophiocordyceps camponoti-saundersi (nom. inval.)]
MASVDDIFKNVGLPSKRKREAITDPNEIYKSSKLSASSQRNRKNDRPISDQGAAAAADDDDDLEAGPAPPPQEQDDSGGHEEAEVGDDDEGRFFGGGISAQESEVLDFVAGVGEDANQGPENIDAAWMRRTAQNLEKRIATNAQLRAKHEGDPQKFIASEAQLDADVKALSILSENPQLYPDFVALGCAVQLAGLLAHDNTDIAIDAIEIIGELTDEDVAAEESQWDVLVDALLDADLIGLLVSNLARLDEADEADRSGVYYALGVVENLCSRSATATRIGAHEDLLSWLLQRVQRKEQSVAVSQNKQYAAEILAILAQSSAQTRRQMAARDAIDVMLQLVATYRKRDPEKGGEEEEYMENLFEALTCLVDEPYGKEKFLEAEGVELCLIMFKDGKRSKGPALRLMDHAASSATTESINVCVKLVDAGGLRPLFTLFIKSRDQRLLGHILGVLASMLRLLPPGSAERIRTLAKFVEKDYEKTSKLVQLHSDYGARVGRAEAQYREEVANSAEKDSSEVEVELLSRRLEAGLFALQQVDVLLAWLVAEDGGARKRIQQLLADKDESLIAVATIIKEQREALDTTEEDSSDMSDMLGTLLEFLR